MSIKIKIHVFIYLEATETVLDGSQPSALFSHSSHLACVRSFSLPLSVKFHFCSKAIHTTVSLSTSRQRVCVNIQMSNQIICVPAAGCVTRWASWIRTSWLVSDLYLLLFLNRLALCFDLSLCLS